MKKVETKLFKIERELRKSGTDEYIFAEYQLNAENSFPWNDNGKYREYISCPHSVVAVSHNDNAIEIAVLKGPDITPEELYCLVDVKIVKLDEVPIKKIDPYRVDLYYGMSGCVEYSIITLKRARSSNVFAFAQSRKMVLHIGHWGTLSHGFGSTVEDFKVVSDHLKMKYKTLDAVESKRLDPTKEDWFQVDDPGVDFSRYDHYATDGHDREDMSFVRYDTPDKEEIFAEKFISFTEVQPVVKDEQDLVAQGFIIPEDYWATDLPHDHEAERLAKKKPKVEEVCEYDDDINVDVAEVVEAE